jgi:hypothetical protein
MNKKEIEAFACEAANEYLSKNHVKKWTVFK